MTLSVHIGGGLCVKTLDWSVETLGVGGGGGGGRELHSFTSTKVGCFRHPTFDMPNLDFRSLTLHLAHEMFGIELGLNMSNNMI